MWVVQKIKYAFLLGVGLFATVFLALFADNILKKK